MIATIRLAVRRTPWLLFTAPLLLVLTPPALQAEPKAQTYWQVDDVRPGMKGTGRTVMKGIKLESFDAEVLGVLKNTSPGRDLVLCRLSGLDLEKTGVIAGMSGSPVYIDGKLLGAVAYAWAFGKEPIAGVTPFAQMHGFVERFERRDLVEQNGKPRRVGLKEPLKIDGVQYDRVTVSAGFDASRSGAEDGLWMVPLRMPVATTGFSSRSLDVLRDGLKSHGLLPVQSGGAAGKIAAKEKEADLQIGGPLAVALVMGDFDMSGIGTVTHIEGDRVYGWGHPFFGMGGCDLPLMTGYIHTIYPRQSISFKMGSPLRTVGVINADVSTCIAGWLGRTPDLLPVQMTVRREGEEARTFKVQVVRQKSLSAQLVQASLVNSLDMEGDLPDEITAEMEARITVEGRKPIIIKDTFSGSGFSGSRAAGMLYQQVSNVIHMLNFNSFGPVRIEKVECETTILAGRRTADIEAVEVDSDVYAPGETLKASVFMRPYKGLPEKTRIAIKLPADLPEGTYTAQICDDLTNARAELRDHPYLNNPQNLEQVFASLAVQTRAKRTNLVVRVPISGVGVAVGGQALPNLPPSMVQIIGATRRSGAQTITGALVARHPTDWVVQGSESIRFTVAKNKKLSGE
ncbi:MAG: SpoIVB peptidase S55 [Planctomycetia bacterium]|nr:SpoIVB peptidase S55 [Planctomycetia bacterium]